jgi:hypothetical protein
MRLNLARALEDSEVLSVRDGREGAGEPDDLGCETQSSERESNHACSIAMAINVGMLWVDLCLVRHGLCFGAVAVDYFGLKDGSVNRLDLAVKFGDPL